MSIRILLVACLLAVPGVVSFAATPADAAFDVVLREYLAVHSHLILDRFDDSSRKSAAALNQASAALMSAQGLNHAAHALVQAMVDRSAELTKAELNAARQIFTKLGDAVDPFLKSYYTGTGKYYRFFCDMLKKPWVQRTDKPVQNPFYDASMRTCGRLVP